MPSFLHSLPSIWDIFWPTWGLVIIGGVAAYIAIETLNDLKVQTTLATQSADIAKKAAEASLLNAQAVINSERPWVSIYAKSRNGMFLFRATNLGRTAAHIVDYSANWICSDTEENIPPQPAYSEDQIPLLSFLIPGKTDDDQHIDLATYDVNSIATYCKQTPELRTAARQITSGIFFFFRIRYRDTISGSLTVHETRMGFWFVMTSQIAGIGGPRSYNAHT